MAQWNPTAAKDLMAFAANHNMTNAVNAFEAHVDNWANGLAAHTVQSFPFGRYTAEVTADSNQVHRIQFDM